VDVTLVTEALSFAYTDRPVLHDVTLPPLRAGEVVALVGPNATGKSTLLKCLAGLEAPGGTVRLDGVAGDPTGGRRPSRWWPFRTGRSALDDHVLYVPQDLPPSTSLTVVEAVLVARQQLRRAERTQREAMRDVEETLLRVGIDDLALQPLAELSGGQRQLVSLAQAVVRCPSVLLLDEPTSTLDLRNQLHILDLIRDVATTSPAAVLVSVHDLSLVSRFADQVVVLRAGTVHAAGRPADVITEEMLREVYEVDAVVTDAGDGGLGIAPRRVVPGL
jgi:iron complex transport system ATP-binding protein